MALAALALLVIFLGNLLVGLMPAAGAAEPAPGLEGVEPQNLSGTLAGVVNATGAYAGLDNPEEGHGNGGTPAKFRLPSQWNYGATSITVSPLFHVKDRPSVTPNTPITGGVSLGVPSFVGTYSGGETAGDYYTDPTFRANQVTWSTSAKSPDGLSTSFAHPTGRGGAETSAGGLADIDEGPSRDGSCLTRNCQSNTAAVGMPEWAEVFATLNFDLGIRPDTTATGSYSFNWAFYTEKMGCEKWRGFFSPWLEPYDTSSPYEGAYGYLYLENPSQTNSVLLASWTFSSGSGTSISGWQSGSMSTTSPTSYLDSTDNCQLRFYIYNEVYDSWDWEQVKTYFSLDTIYLSLSYAGDNFPLPDMVFLNSKTSSASTAGETWTFPGQVDASTSYAISIDTTKGAQFSSFQFYLASISATAYYNAYVGSASGNREFMPSLGSTLQLGVTSPVPLAIAGDRCSASGVIPYLGTFSGYDPRTGWLSFTVRISSILYDYITYTLAIGYTITIPFAVPYTSGAGSTTVNIPSLTAFSLQCTQAQVADGPYVLTAAVDGGPKTVTHTPRGYSGTCPHFNSSWPLLHAQAILESGHTLAIAITTDATAPLITDWKMPQFAAGDGSGPADYAVVPEGQFMWFEVTYTDATEGHAYLMWTNASGSWNVSMEQSAGYAYLDISADQFYYGQYDFSMLVVDKAGNEAATESRKIKIVTEGQPPVIALIGPQSGVSFASAFTIAASVDDVNLNDSEVFAEVLGSKFRMNATGNGGSGFFTLAPGFGDWTAWQVFVASLPQGNYAFVVTARDTRGNEGTTSPVFFAIDLGAPWLNVLTPSNGSAHATPPRIAVDVRDAASNVSVYYSVNGGTVWTVTENQVPPATVAWTVDAATFKNLADGPFEVGIAAFDTTGENFALAKLQLRKDATVPHVTISNLVTDSLLGAKPPVLNFTVADDSATSVTIEITCGTRSVPIVVPSSAGTPTHGNETAYSVQIPSATWATVQWEGPATVAVSARDAQDLAGAVTVPVIVDTVAPRVTIMWPETGLTVESRPTVRVVSEDAHFLIAWYTLDGGVSRYAIAGLPGTANFACDETAWDAAYQKYVYLLVIVEDRCGNVGFANVTLVRGDWLEYGAGPNPWIIFAIFEQAWPVQVIFWAPVILSVIYAVSARQRKKTRLPPKEVTI